jgi:hypothetical protein
MIGPAFAGDAADQISHFSWPNKNPSSVNSTGLVSTWTERARPESNIQYVAQCEYDERENGNPKSIQSDVRDWCEHADHRDYRDY